MPATEKKSTQKPYQFDLVPIPIVTEASPHAGFLTGKPAEEFLREYKRRVSADYGGNNALDVLAYDEKQGVITGSNPFAVVLANQLLRDNGLHVATMADLERVLRTGDAIDISHHYVDIALFLVSEDDPHSYLAHDIAKQIKERNGGKPDFPVMVPLRCVEVENDESSPKGLRFKLSGDTIVYAPILNEPNNFSSVNENTGLPIETGSLCTVTSGLSRLRLGGGLVLDADVHDLAISDSYGRVVVVRDGAEGATPQSAVRAYTLQDIETARKELEEMRRVDANAGKNIEALLEKLKKSQ